MTGADLRRTVRRLTAGIAGSAVVVAGVVTGGLIYNGYQPAAVADPTDVAGTWNGQGTPSADDDEVQDENDAVGPAAPIQPPTVARGGAHASSGGS